MSARPSSLSSSKGADFLLLFIATGLFSSYLPGKLVGQLRPSLPPAVQARLRPGWAGAGFMGTLLGLALFPALPEQPLAYAAVVAVSIAAACALCTAVSPQFEKKDDPRIVIDEVVGFWTTAAFVPREPAVLAAAFVLFRIFDAWKPGPIQAFERLPSGAGVVMDDVAAGVTANLVLQACLRVF